MQNRYLNHMLGEFVREFAQPGMAWQLAALLADLVLAYLLARWCRARRDTQRRARFAAVRHGVESLNKALFPILGWLIVGATQLGLAKVMPTPLLSVAMVALFGVALVYLALYFVRRIFTREGESAGLLHFFERAVIAAVWIMMALYVTGTLDDVVHWMGSVRFNIATSHISLLSLMTGAVWVGLTLLIALWAGAALEDRLKRTRELDPNLRVVLSRLGRGLLLVGAVLLSLSFVGIDITVLGVFSGALGVGLGFGLQKIASNYVSGFIILIDRSLRLGDWISVGGFQGTVTQIKTRFTVVRGLDGVETLIPNEKLIGDVVQNHSSYFTRVHAKLPVQVAYSADVELALRLLVEAAQGVERVLPEPPPTAYLARFGGDGIDLEIGFWIDEVGKGTAAVRSAVNQAIWRTFKAHCIDIPFAQREIRILNPENLPAKPDGPVKMPDYSGPS